MVRNEKDFQARFGWLPSEILEHQYAMLFKHATKYNPNRTYQAVGGKTAVAFFSRAGLPTTTLKLIWNIADYNRNGELDFEQFCVACRLISLAQNGHDPSIASLKSFSWMSIPLPKFQGIDIDTSTPSIKHDGTGIQSRRWYLAPEKRIQYSEAYSITPQTKEAQYKLLGSYGLSHQQMTLLWDICDTGKTGVLNEDEFCVAIHLANGVGKQGMEMPTSLPSEFGLRSKKLRSTESEAKSILQQIDAAAETNVKRVVDQNALDFKAIEKTKALFELSSAAAQVQAREVQNLFELSCVRKEAARTNDTLREALRITKDAAHTQSNQKQILKAERDLLQKLLTSSR